MGRSGLNMVKAGKQNRAVILQTISDEGAVSRKRIAEITGLTPAGITLITNELLSEGLIREGERVSPDHKAGRRQVLLELCPQVKYVWSVNLDIASAVAALCDLSGNAVWKKKMTLPKEKDQFAREAGSLILAETEKLDPEVRKKIAAVGVGVPGLVNREEGIWDNEIPVVSVLEEMTGLPCVLENNINAFAEAEIMFGMGRERDNLLIVKWGPGCGQCGGCGPGGVYRKAWPYGGNRALYCKEKRQKVPVRQARMSGDAGFCGGFEGADGPEG